MHGLDHKPDFYSYTAGCIASYILQHIQLQEYRGLANWALVRLSKIIVNAINLASYTAVAIYHKLCLKAVILV